MRAIAPGLAPSIRKAASVNGAPAKPISGSAPSSSRRRARISSPMKARCRGGSQVFRRVTAAASRTGSFSTGPGENWKSAPIGSSGVRMSWYMMIASTPMRRGSSESATACSGDRNSACKDSPVWSR